MNQINLNTSGNSIEMLNMVKKAMNNNSNYMENLKNTNQLMINKNALYKPNGIFYFEKKISCLGSSHLTIYLMITII